MVEARLRKSAMIYDIEKTKQKEEETTLPPRKRGRLRSISSRTRSSSLKSQTTKSPPKYSTCGLEATNASRSLLKVIDECFQNSPKQMAKSTSDSGIQRRNRISSDQVSPS